MSESADPGGAEPDRSSRRTDASWLRTLGVVSAAVLATTVAARIRFEIPGASVPQTAQTLVVLGTGVLLGSRLGAVAMAAYWILAVAGLPLLASGTVGLGVLYGGGAGYLLGFVVAATLAGYWVEKGYADTPMGAFAGMLAGHVVILLLGWLRLSFAGDPIAALYSGVMPFFAGGVAKSFVAGVFAWRVAVWRQARSGVPPR